MGRKSSAKAHTPASQKPPVKSSRSLGLIGGGIAVALVVGIVAYMQTRQTEPAASTSQASADRPSATDLKPHPQANLPPLQFPGYAMPRSAQIVTAAYKFAAEHPEVLSYVPCFCGCERSGHRGNEDCFVKARDINGDVVLWDDHGMECAVCIDVATRSRQLFESGKSVRDIRKTIDAEFGARAMTHTHTPEPPANQ